MQTPQDRRFSPEELASLNGLGLSPSEQQQLLKDVPVYEELLKEKLSPLEVYKIQVDKQQRDQPQ